MTQLIALSPSNHTGYGFKPRSGYHFTKTQSIVPILLAELSKLLPHYPLAFIKEKDQYQAVALIGDGKKNLYVNDDGKWLSEYVPSGVRGYPFAIATNDKGQRLFCLHEEHLTKDVDCPHLFTATGELNEDARNHFQFLTQCETNRQQTEVAVKALHEAQLLIPWELVIADAQGKGLSINGLLRIDEQGLNRLPAETLVALRNCGALALAYAQMFSMAQHTQLTARLKYHAQSTAAVTENDIAQIFAKNDDILKFDF